MSFTDYEEGIAFDTDDPDFDNNNCRNINLLQPIPNGKLFVGDTRRNCVVTEMPSFSPVLPSKLYVVGDACPYIEVPRNGLPISGRMSVASVHPVGGLTNRSQSFNSVSSLDEISTGSYLTPETAVLSIEELRLQLNSCFTCGVSWQDDHVSLDCSECGGYSLERPCPLCDGRCSSLWKRDLTMSHACGKARWEGTCSLTSKPEFILKPLSTEEEARLCGRMEKVAASS